MNDYAELIRRWKETSLLGSCSAVLGWDERTYMPRNGSALRADQLALLARLCHERVIDPQIGDLLSKAEATSADADAQANLREIRRACSRAVKIPAALVEELARTTTRAQQAWAEARAANKYSQFQPWLEKIVNLKRQEADAVGWKDHPYDALIDEFEPGTTTKSIASLFAELAADLTPLVAALLNSKRQPNREILHREFPVETQQSFGKQVAESMGFNFQAGRLDVTTHPFCSGIGPGDCRITTRYNPRHFNEAFFGVLHEAGHGLYEQNLAAEHFGTPLGAAASYGIHESQSRLWENQVGRSRPFWEGCFPKAQTAFPAALGNVTLDDFLFAINDVQASFIRVEADEATYNLHIILRFELELALLKGDLKPADLPDAWNGAFRRLLGITPPDHAKGCLQDIHWSFGGVGYFPTYTLGNLFAAQFMQQVRQDLGSESLDADFRKGEFGRLRTWLVENIHRHGQRYRPGALCERITGRPLSHKPFIEYLRGKFGPLYGV